MRLTTKQREILARLDKGENLYRDQKSLEWTIGVDAVHPRTATALMNGKHLRLIGALNGFAIFTRAHKVGRPPVVEKRVAFCSIKATKSEAEALRAGARKAGKPVGTWLRELGLR